MGSRGRDTPSLVAGLTITLFGAILLLDRTGALHLGFEALGPLVCAVVGAILLATGLSRRD